MLFLIANFAPMFSRTTGKLRSADDIEERRVYYERI